jgi:hypothetical protein
MSPIKKLTLRLLMIGALVCAILQKLEWLSVVALILTFAAFAYDAGPVRRMVQIVLGHAGTARSAKFKDFELELDAESTSIKSSALSQAAPWIRIVAGNLKSYHITLLCQIAKVVHFEFHPSVAERLRELRDQGLIVSEASSLSASKTVRLTGVGEEFVAAILAMPPKISSISTLVSVSSSESGIRERQSTAS